MLGPVEIERDGELAPLTSHRQRAVLAMLLMAEGRTVSVERLIEGVWGEDLPANPTNTLQHAVAQIRKALEPGRARSEPPTTVVSTEGGYRLPLDDHALDAADFEAAIERAEALCASGDIDAAVAELTDGLGLWRGTAYAEFEADGFADGESRRLAERYRVGQELLVDARLAASGPQAVVAELEALVAEHPHREALWARLMTSLYQSGRQAEALRTYQRAATSLGEELGILPSPALQALEQQILLQDPELDAAPTVPATAAVTTTARPRHNLPALTTSLIGREEELTTLLGALEVNRLVTILGPGGSGKTRLALEAAQQLASIPSSKVGADGIWMVRLDDLNDPSLLAPSVGAALGMPESGTQEVIETIVAHIGMRRILLVLDNCEHLLDAASDLVHQLITSCPEAAVLATSQAPLRLSGEQRMTLPPLALPGDEGSPFAELEASAAVRLFIERAAGLGADDIVGVELNAVANIVRALDGIPLAIELAAARTDLLSPTEIAQLLADRFDLLTDGPRDAPRRQRTLRDTVAWSHGLLDDDGQLFFARLAVFSGGFDAEAAAAVTELDPASARALIGRLTGRSLLTRETVPGARSRFRMLETLRQFGLELIETNGERTPLRRRHAEFFADRAFRLDQDLMGPDQAIAFASYIADEDNLRAAMAWSLEVGRDDADRWVPGVRIAARSSRFWDWRGSLAEANTWLGRLARAVTDETIADLPVVVSWLAYFTAELGDEEQAQAQADRAGRLADDQGDPYAQAMVESGNALYARLRGDPGGAIAAADRVRALGTAQGDRWVSAWADNHDALAYLAAGDREAATRVAERSHVGFSELGDQRATGWALTVLAQVALERGDHEQARGQACQAVSVSIGAGDGRNAAWASELAAAAARAGGDKDGAAELDEQAKALLAARGMPRSPWHRS